MVSALNHRGPDEAGIYRDARAGLAHTRLSIIDLATGQQPLSSGDGSLWIVFNGEIYNYLELRAELEERGVGFRSHSDTEVIVQAFAMWGESAFQRMNGQWAIALWDETRERLILSRDPHGICPLYIHEAKGVLTFASEIKAIFASDSAIERRFDPRGLAETFTFWTVVPPQSVFAGVSEIEPGHVRIYERGTVRDFAYSTTEFPAESAAQAGFTGTPDEAVERVREALEAATRLRMLRSDVPVGCYLSGGLDSSLVAALGRRFAPGRFHTFSLRFEDAEYDETEFQRLMVAQLDSAHHELVVTRAEIAAVFPAVICQTERPLLRSAPAPLYCLSKLAHDRGLKVVLTGEGADEMFAGYDLFREAKVRRFWAREPASRRRPRVLERLYPYLARSPVAQQALARQFFGRNLERHAEPGFGHSTRWQGTAALQRLFSRDQRAATAGCDVVGDLLGALPSSFATWGSLQQDQFLEMKTLLSGYLLASQGDRMLMAHSVEGRFPFLDPQVAALAHSLPASYKLKVLDEKHTLKRVARGMIPAAIVGRKKQPYRAPDALSFVGGGSPEYLEHMFSARAVAAAGVFDPAAVAQLWSKCQARPGLSGFSNTDNMAVVGVLSTQLLHHHFIEQRPGAGSPRILRTDVDRLPQLC